MSSSRRTPTCLGISARWVEAGGYQFQEDQQNQAGSAGWSLGMAAGVQLNTGNRADQNPLSPKKHVAAIDVEPSAGSTKTRTNDAVVQNMTRFDMLNRALPWLRVSPNAIVTVILTARNERDRIRRKLSAARDLAGRGPGRGQVPGT